MSNKLGDEELGWEDGEPRTASAGGGPENSSKAQLITILVPIHCSRAILRTELKITKHSHGQINIGKCLKVQRRTQSVK